MSETEYYRDAVIRIRDLMQDTFKDKLNVYYVGLPLDIPEAAYPCCIIQKQDGNVSVEKTGEDIMLSRINIYFLKRQALDMNASNSVNTTMRELQHMIEGRDPVSSEWLSGTAMHALRTNVTLSDDTTLLLDSDVRYDARTYEDESTVSEAFIQIIARERVSVPVRS